MTSFIQKAARRSRDDAQTACTIEAFDWADIPPRSSLSEPSPLNFFHGVEISQHLESCNSTPCVLLESPGYDLAAGIRSAHFWASELAVTSLARY